MPDGKHLRIAGAALAVALLAACSRPQPETCDHSCLIGELNGYLQAVVAHDAGRASLAPEYRETQNAVEVPAGDGIWATATGLGLGVRYADPVTAEAGYFGIVEEASGPVLAGLRIRLQDRSVSEAEWILARSDMALYKPEGFAARLPRAVRPLGTGPMDRAAAIAVANSYFEGIDESDGTLVMQHPECFRIENGTQMVGRRPDEPPHTAERPAGDGLNGATAAGISSCTHEFDQVGKRTEDVLDRRFFYDPEANLVWSHGTFSRVPGAVNPQGQPWKWLNFMELFELEDGRIRGIYAAMDYLPEQITSSGWGGADE